MKTFAFLLFIVLLTARSSQQDLILTSDTSVQVEISDVVPVTGGALPKPKLTPIGITLTPIISGDTTVPPSNNISKTVATLQDPNIDALALQSQLQKTSISDIASNSQVNSDLAKAQWIYGGDIASKVIFWSSCFYNYCPRSVFTLYFETTCRFTIYLTDQNGNVIKTIGSGTGWLGYVFTFTGPCGRLKLKFVLSCSCNCPFMKFNLYQNKKQCFTCPDQIRQTYNPSTCQCQCANKCGCNKNQIWAGIPTCSCICAREMRCTVNQFWNKAICACQCLPTCCLRFPVERQTCDCIN